MIDITRESLVEFGKWWLKGVPMPHVSQFHRWRQKGLLSETGQRVKLESILIGQKRYTSIEAVQRFIDAQNDGPDSVRQRKIESAALRKAAIAAAGKALEAIGA